MKRLLLLLAFMLGVSLGCDQPYEEILGFNVGCSFNGDKSALKPDAKRSGVFTQTLKLKDDFFDTVRVEVYKGNIEALMFNKNYQESADMRSDFNALTNSLKDRWGDAKEINKEGVRSFTNRDPKSDVLGLVFVFNLYDGATGSINVVYSSKKYQAYNDRGNKESVK